MLTCTEKLEVREDGELILNVGDGAYLYADGIAEYEVQYLRTDSTLDMLFIYEIGEEE